MTTALWFIRRPVLLFYGGSAFAFFWVLPAAIQFFMGFATVSLQPMFSLSRIYRFHRLSPAFRPGLRTAPGPPGPVPPGDGDGGHAESQAPRLHPPGLHLCRRRIATTDMFTQTCIAIPMIVLYEGTIISSG